MWSGEPAEVGLSLVGDKGHRFTQRYRTRSDGWQDQKDSGIILCWYIGGVLQMACTAGGGGGVVFPC